MHHLGVGRRGQIPRNSWFKNIYRYVNKYVHTANFVGLFGAACALFFLLALPGSNYWNIRIPLYLIVVIWTLLRPRVALYMMPIAVPWGTVDTVNMGGLHFADILAGLLAISWLMSFPLRPLITREATRSGPLDYEGRLTIPRYLALAMLALLLAMLVSMATTSSLLLSIKEVVKWLEVLVILLLGAQYIRTRRQIWTLVIIFCLAASSQAIFGYIQYFFDLGPASFVRDASLRVYGSFEQPNPFAGYINMALTIALALTLLSKNVAMRILAGSTAIILAGVVYLSQSKGGWIALLVALLFIVTVGLPRLRVFIGAGAIAMLGLIGSYLVGILPQRLFTPILASAGLINISFTTPTHANYANSERLAHWVAGIHMFEAHPFFGVGIGNYAAVYPQYALGVFIIPLGHAHNYYINIAAESGIFGLLTFLLFLLATFIAGGHIIRGISKKWRQLQAQRAKPQADLVTLQRDQMLTRVRLLTNDRALAIGLLAALLSICVHNVVDNLYVHGMASLFALLLIMLIRLEATAPN